MVIDQSFQSLAGKRAVYIFWSDMSDLRIIHHYAIVNFAKNKKFKLCYNGGMQKCSRCKKTKHESNFYKGSNNGYSSYCKPCSSEYNKTKVKRKRRRTYADSRKQECRTCGIIKPVSDYPKGRLSCKVCVAGQAFVRNIEKKYNITYEQWETMHNAQNNRCAICARKEKLLIDHDHSCCSGQYSCGQCVRGLICFKCNVTLGLVGDDVDILSKMVGYLKSY